MRRAAKILFIASFAVLGSCEMPEEEGIDPETEDPEVTFGDGKSDGASTVPTVIITAAKANLKRVAADIDSVHLYSYGYRGTADYKFYYSMRKEFLTQQPEMYRRRMQVLASIAFIQAPQLQPPAGGRPTPFHGLDPAAYGRLMTIEDTVFNKLVSLNAGSVKGVRPFSVCETRFMIDKYVKAGINKASFTTTEWTKYKTDLTAYAAMCPQLDKDEWYDFRGLGKLRPTWLESNVMDRFTRKYTELCRSSTNTSPECVAYRANRLKFRDDKNAEMGRRMFVYDPSQEAFLADPAQSLVVVPDQNGDGVGEIIKDGVPYNDMKGKMGNVTITSTGEFTGKLPVSPQYITAITAVDPKFDPKQDLLRNDFGLFRMFPTAGACDTTKPNAATCPVLKRLYVMIDRHENFYQTYTSLNPTSTSLGKQPSPLVACSITLRASDWWAHNSPAGVDGFVYLMRVPFKAIVAGTPTAVSSIAPKPVVTTMQELYRNNTPIDFTSAWVDVASLSNNMYASEHEISKYGYVRPDQIEGIIYTGIPAVVP